MIMKTLVIGDLHGRTQWKFITANEDYDKVVFLGDYFDSHENITHEAQIKNFEDLLTFKSDSPDKVVILYGNHDHSYYCGERCSGYNPEYADRISEVIKEADQLSYLQAVYVQDDVIMSHAGVSKYWLQNIACKESPSEITLEDPSIFDFNYVTGVDYYGDTISQSPIWIRPKSLVSNALEDYRQIVGHTPYLKPVVFNDRIYCNDLMPLYYIMMEDGDIIYKNTVGTIISPIKI